MNRTKILLILILVLGAAKVYGAVGCTLNDPDRDVKRLFPKATNYKTEFITIKKRGGKKLAAEIEAKLKNKLEKVYESLDVPYAYYTILRKKETIGYVHGVNQKGMYGGIQIILASDPNGVIVDCYYQKISSPESRKFKNKKFTKQFVGMSLKDFYTRDIKKLVKDPSKKSSGDWLASLRGIRKNLILHDEFMLKNKYDKYLYKKKNEDVKEKAIENRKDTKNEDTK